MFNSLNRTLLFIVSTLPLLSCESKIKASALVKRVISIKVEYIHPQTGDSRTALVSGTRKLNTRIVKNTKLQKLYTETQANYLFSTSLSQNNINTLRQLPSLTRFDYILDEEKNRFISASCSTPVKFKNEDIDVESHCVISAILDKTYIKFLYSGDNFRYNDIKNYSVYIVNKYLNEVDEQS